MLQSHKAEQNDLNGHKTALNTKNSPYCRPEQTINIFSTQSDRSTGHFSFSFKQRTRMRMSICTHGQQTGGKEIDQTATF